MFNLDILFALLFIFLIAKIFYRLGYTICFAEICDTYKVNSDDLLEDLMKNAKNKNKKEI